ncbi:zinc-finger homeodomain protein 5-like [Lycium ferocissimum]|uniref:zinc-finger homeodomain protein 5-like n=1 Tax=Lycium ferocissimum TaxID=112874 RepID=UPI002815740E|nr:zinc-finger homeodomain protein 5-like [Lycium ferocissimum]
MFIWLEIYSQLLECSTRKINLMSTTKQMASNSSSNQADQIMTRYGECLKLPCPAQDQTRPASYLHCPIAIAVEGYGKCLKNHATRLGQYLLDGCRKFVKSGEDRTKGAYVCAKCHCLRSFHRMHNLQLHQHQGTGFCFFHHCVHPHGGNASRTPIFHHSTTHQIMPTSSTGESQVLVSTHVLNKKRSPVMESLQKNGPADATTRITIHNI